MKLLSLEEFVKLPSGTIYSEYVPETCRGLFVKMDTIEHPEDGPPADFFLQQLLPDDGCPPELNLTPRRWALFDFSAQFAVYDRNDLAEIARYLE